MKNVTQIEEQVYQILEPLADRQVCRIGFMHPERQISGSSFAYELLFGWLEHIYQTLGRTKCAIRVSGPSQRFTKEAHEPPHPPLAVLTNLLI